MQNYSKGNDIIGFINKIHKTENTFWKIHHENILEKENSTEEIETIRDVLVSSYLIEANAR